MKGAFLSQYQIILNISFQNFSVVLAKSQGTILSDINDREMENGCR